MADKGKKTCPVCDALIAVDARKCPSCDTDLTLFDIDMDGELDVDKIEISDEKAIDDILSSIVGKDESSKLLEDIKSIGKNSEVDYLEEEVSEEAEPTEVVEAEEEATFECPSCRSMVGISESSCPNCGVEFEEEEIMEFECPVCNAPVSSNATSCDNCGVRFETPEEGVSAEEEPGEMPQVETPPEPEPEPEPGPEIELEEMAPEPPKEAPPTPPPEKKVPTLSERLLAERRRKVVATPPETFEGEDSYTVLPALVNEIKPILAIAKKNNINIGGSKELISQAVVANREGQIERAVEIIQRARIMLDDSLTREIAKDIEDFVDEVKEAKKVGCDVAGSEELIREAITSLRKEDYEVAISDLDAAINELQRTAGTYREATQSLEEASELISAASALGIDAKESVELLAEGREALDRKGWETATLFAKRALDGVVEVLPDILLEEMKKAKDSLLELKMRGGDLRKAMGIYKQASIAIKKKEFSDALKYLKSFKGEVGS